MRLPIPLGVFLLGSALLTVLGYHVIDHSLSRYVQAEILARTFLGRHADNIPDALLVFVSVTETAAVSGYFYLARRSRSPLSRACFLDIAWAVPVAYVLKSILKLVFGRINTKIWLFQPTLDGFHWFRGVDGFTGFPSGHMVVFSTLIAALWRFYPLWRPLHGALLVALGAALVGTNYHFFSDVTAGMAAGVLVEAVTWRYLASRRPEADFLPRHLR